MATPASDNGGRYNQVHNQAAGEEIITAPFGGEYLPVSFTYVDWTGEEHSSLLGYGYPHDKLMRSDCGIRYKHEDSDITFDYSAKVRIDMPSDNGYDNYYETHIEGHDVRICGLASHRSIAYRKDREYWTPGETLSAEEPEELFGWEQFNPATCPVDDLYNDCGVLEFKEDNE